MEENKCQKLMPSMWIKNPAKKDEEILGSNFWVFWNPFCKKMEEISREETAG